MSQKANTLSQPPYQIEVKVAEIHQLFDSMDPSPFHERDLDRAAEQFIIGWAQEYPRHGELRLLVYLGKAPPNISDPQAMIAKAMRNFFNYRADIIHREFRQLMREGRMTLLIGVAFLILCQAIAQSIPFTGDTWHSMLREGLTIIGWVAMWRPVEIYLYRWWPLLHLEKVYRMLASAQIEVRSLS